MARKSRTTEAEFTVSDPHKYKVAVYARLSKEKEETIERGTIDNQISLIRGYVERYEDMEIADTYVDDSMSGTSFDRPGFERMIADMKADRFNTIVVKDLSRLGRDYIETGNLIERVFPMYGIRFIAVTDGYDSNKGASELMMPVTNIANALYAQDISKKIKSSKRTQMEQGIPVGHVPYGYKVEKDSAGVRVMVVDEDAAAVIREVFRRYLGGEKKMEIAAVLNGRGIPTPYQYRFRSQPEKLAGKEHLQWTLANVNSILKNDVYTGRYVVGKDVQNLYRHEKRHTTPESEWIVFEEHHPALVSKEDFAAAQSIGKKLVIKRKPEQNMFRGKVVCGCCGSAVCYFRNHEDRFYQCARKRRYGARNSGCTSNSISKKYFCNTVLAAIQETIRIYIDEDAVVKAYSRSERGRARRRILQEGMEKALQDVEKAKEVKSGLYADYKEGLLNEAEYLLMNREYSEKIEALKQKIQETAAYIERFDKTPLGNEQIRKAVMGFKGRKKLTQEMVDAFIEKITIYEHRLMDICFTFDDEMKLLFEKRTEREEQAL